MNLLEIAKTKCIAFKGTISHQGLEAVVHHVEIAERHFENGKALGEYFYTDVIYRTNQAFEGALKEAFRLLAGLDSSKMSPYQIEKILETKGLLKARVLSQFTNYRTEWRNKSTHDYQLFFSSQEALLAIVSVTAFFNILLDQMLEKHAFDLEKARIETMASQVFSDVQNYDGLGFLQQCVQLLLHFSRDSDDKQINFVDVSEYELIGKLTGFIAAADPLIDIATDEMVEAGGHKHRADIVLEKSACKVVVEVKRASIEPLRRIRDGIEQVKKYMNALNVEHGIVFLSPRVANVEFDITYMNEEINDAATHIAVVAPKKMLRAPRHLEQ